MDNLDLINSIWLIDMLKKSSNKPQVRLLSLFDILEDWLNAPNLSQINNQTQTIPVTPNHQLQDFLTLEAAKAGAAMPEMLASQLYFMAVAAAQEKLQANNSLSLIHAKNAAHALIAAQTEKEFRIVKSYAYAIAASVLGISVVVGSMFILNKANFKVHPEIAQTEPSPIVVNVSTIASPQQTSALIGQIDQMRKGNCQLIEALQLPDSYKKVYFENIVLGQISTNVEDQKLVHQLLKMVRCNYTPMLMANSRG
ncbi:MAG: hypothetical protein V4605_00045 [Pseudomonadota bacterium]